MTMSKSHEMTDFFFINVCFGYGISEHLKSSCFIIMKRFEMTGGSRLKYF